MKKVRILIVEDEAIVAEDLAMAITDIGYEVVGRAGSAEDAVKKAVELKPDLVLMDIVLRGRENGIDTSHEIKEKMDIPIIFLTAFSDIELLDSAKSIEPYAYIIKPFQERQLLASIEMALHKNRMEKKLKEREKFSSSLLNNSPNPIIVVNPDTSVRYVNPAMEKLTGFSSAELVGKKAPYPWWTEETLRKTRVNLEVAMRKGATKLEEQFQKKNGERFWVVITSTPVRSNGEFKYYLSNWVNITEQKRAEEEIRKLSSAVEQAIDGIAIYDLDLKLSYVNDSFATMHGYSPEEMIGMKVENLHNEERLDEYRSGMNQIKAQGSWAGETWRLKKDGTLFPAFMTVTILKGDDGNHPGILAVARDITKQKRAEVRLQEREAQYRGIFNSATDSLLIFDTDGNIEEVNPQACEMYGYLYEELITLSGKDIVHPDYYHLFEQFKRDVQTTGKFHAESVDVHKDGTPFNIELTGAGFNYRGEPHLLAIVRDITERKRAEEEVKRSHEFLATIIDNIPDIVTIKDPQYRLVLVNQAYCNITGHTKEEVIGKKAYWEKDKEIFQTGKGLDLPEQSYTDLESTCHYISVKKAPLTDESGKPTHVLTISRDITERKHAEEKAKEAYRLREHFLRETSHRIITPVTIIGGNADLLLDSSNLDDDQKARIRTIREKDEEVQKLVRDALAGRYLKEEEKEGNG